MKCPNCEKDLTEGKLYCENCGYEIQIVPDFEPELENSITQTLSSLAEELTEPKEDFNELSFEESLEKPDYFGHFWKRIKRYVLKVKGQKRVVRMTVLLAAVLFVAISIFATIKAYQYNSYNYQLNKALSLGKKEAYIEAVTHLERAIKIDDTDPDASLLLAEYYDRQDKKEDAIFILEGAILNGNVTEDIYRKLIGFYEEKKEFDRIGKLLSECEDKEIVTTFQSYAALKPEFSVAEGSYEEVVPLKLIGNTSGEIYYTMDGSTPNEKSPLYTSPLFLESGTYVVSAVFVNKYGVKSDVVQKTYQIEVIQPYPPEISLYSGLYQVPEMIEAEVSEGEKVFYTTDGKIPTMDATPYTGPIPMPFGATNFKFASFSQDGISSEVVERAYRLQIPANVSVNQALEFTTARLIEHGILTDAEGHLKELEGKNIYICSSAITFGNQIYYLIFEFYEDTAGSLFKTEKEYAVNATTGDVAFAVKEKSGYYQVLSLENTN